jgi:hypothetical protein
MMPRERGSSRAFAICLLALALHGCGGTSLKNPYEDIEDPTDAADGVEDAIVDASPEVPIGDAPADSSVDVDGGPPKCTRNEDCANVDLGSGEECRQKKYCNLQEGKVCELTWQAGCCRDREILLQGFEGGLDGWIVGNDPNTADRVTWSASTNRRAFGASSAYFGDPVCRTYYNGAMDSGCLPVDPKGLDAGLVTASLTSPPFALPPLDLTKTSFFVSFYVWIKAEPPIPTEGQPIQLDLFRVFAVLDPGTQSESKVAIFTSASVGNTTGDRFIHVVGDLSTWRNRTIAIQLDFNSLDNRNNSFEGVYVDEIRVATSCNDAGAAAPGCSPTTACAADDVPCTDDSCQVFSNAVLQGAGVCGHPLMVDCG